MPALESLSGSHEAPAQHKQSSRKGKKAWRKNVDVTEVEKGLDERNEQIIKGGILAERESTDLFTVDTVGDVANSVKFQKHIKKGLKADEIIAQRSAVPAVPQRKRANDKTTDGIIPAKRQRTNYVSQKELARLRMIADGIHDSTIEVKDAEHDPWAVAPPTKTQDDKFPFIPKTQAVKAPKSSKQEPISLAANGKTVPAVKKPAGGYSYNPAFTEYEQRFTEAGNKELEAEKKRLVALEEEEARLAAAARSAAEADAAEARAELSEWDEDSAWEGFESGGEELAVKTKRPQRKTQAQRNKIKRRKEEEQKLKHEAAMRRRKDQEQKIKSIAEEVAEREELRALAKIEMSDGSDEGDDNELRRRRLGKIRLPEKDLELVLPDELQDSLRLLKPEGNLLKDRYRNMLVRGKLESRRKLPFRKQKKMKATEKWSYKDFKI